MKKLVISKKLKYGASAVVFTAVAIVAVLLVNIIASVITDRYNLNADMTADQRYEISDDTVKLLKNVDNKLTIYMLATEQEAESGLDIYGPSIVSVLKRYPVLSGGKVNVEFIDIDRNPTFTQDYDLGKIEKYSILVKSEAAYKLLTYYDYLYWRAADSYSDPESVGLDIEHALASAITYCDTGAKRNAVLLSGKGEEAGDKLVSFLESNNFNITYMNLATEILPEDTDLIIINSPEQDYSASEIDQIDKYLNDDLGKIIVSMGNESAKAANLKMYLKNYGISYQDYSVYDMTNSLTGHPESIVCQTTESDMLTRIDETNTMIIMPNSIQLTYTDISGTGWTREDLLNTKSTSFIKELDLERIAANVTMEAGDLSGSFGTATLLTRNPTVDVENNETAGKILVLSSGDALNDTYLNSGAYSNWTFMSVLISDFYGGDDLSKFKYKLFGDSELVTLESDRQVILGVLIAIPVAMLGCGVIVWVRRKNM